jgi:prevent-host-death family protein
MLDLSFAHHKLVNLTNLSMAMDETITAAEANRSFSKLLRAIREGRSYVITAHGRPVARIGPVPDGDATAARAKEALLARLEAQPVTDIGPWIRDELYEDEP